MIWECVSTKYSGKVLLLHLSEPNLNIHAS
jgi:hypothetical protein